MNIPGILLSRGIRLVNLKCLVSKVSKAIIPLRMIGPLRVYTNFNKEKIKYKIFIFDYPADHNSNIQRKSCVAIPKTKHGKSSCQYTVINI